MTYVGRVRVNYGNRPTRLERLRAADDEYCRLRETFHTSEKLWAASDRSRDQRLLACIGVVVPLAQFAVNVGVTPYANARLNDLLVALDELISGRHSVLLSPSPVHSRKYSATDLQQQAMVQVCVDLLREAGASATEARAKISHLCGKHQLPRFGEAKLRALNSRLKGRGSSQDEAYGLYIWAKSHAQRTAETIGVNPARDLSQATKLADALIKLTKARDHRRDFFFALRENSSEIP